MQISKKIVASYLDNKCDRKLFLSIINRGGKKELPQQERSRLQIPEPFKIRTRGLGLTQQEGRDLEDHYYYILNALFKSSIIDLSSSRHKKHSLFDALSSITNSNSPDGKLILEGMFSMGVGFDKFLTRIGVANESVNLIPPLTDLRPDIIAVLDMNYFQSFDDNAYEILPDGQLDLISANDKRKLLFLVDIKSSEDADVSQFSEVALYAWMLSNWLEDNSLSNQYAVVDSIGIWTRNAKFEDAINTQTLITLTDWIDLISNSTFDQFMLPLKTFFTIDVPRVISNIDNWKKLEYHLTPSCDTCDYLGRLDRDKEKYVVENKTSQFYEQLCTHQAQTDLHTSRIPGMTKGACRSLAINKITNLRDLYSCDSRILDQHTELKRQKHILADRARSIDELLLPDFFESMDFTLDRLPNLGIMFHINYDVSIGQAVSFSVQGAGFPWSKENNKTGIKANFFDGKKVFLTVKESHSEELEILKKFLDYIKYMIDQVCSVEFNTDPEFNIKNESTRPSVQFYCWDINQLTYMKKILSRHIHVLLDERYTTSLLWLFSPNELLQHPGYFKPRRGSAKQVMTPYICIIKNIISRYGRFPLETTYPLMAVAGCLDEEFNNAYLKTSNLYKSQLGDYIPRERILEIWLNQPAKTDVINEKAKLADENLTDDEIKHRVIEKYIDQYKKTCAMQVWALSLLRKYIAKEKKIKKVAYAPPIIFESILDIGNIKSLPADSQLWILFSLLDDHLNILEYQQEIASDIVAIESRYGCIVVTDELSALDRQTRNIQANNFRRYFSVSEDSKNCKLREGDGYLTLLLKEIQGFPFMRPIDVLRMNDASEDCINQYHQTFNHELFRPFHDLISVTLNRFSRVDGWIEVSINCGKNTGIVNRLLSDRHLVIDKNIAITQSKPLDRFPVVQACLKAIGHPEGITSSEISRTALLKNYPEKTKKGQNLCRAAEVLWHPASLFHNAQNNFMLSNIATLIKDVSARSKRPEPNPSQTKAILHAVSNGLSVIWGPPGT